MIYDLVLKNRSYRNFSRETIGRENLVKYVDMARITASSANLQALKYKVVADEAECAKTFACTKWAGYLPDMEIPEKGSEPTGYIVICIDTDITKNIHGFYKDTGIAAQTIMLAASEDGFGGCMIGSFNEEKLKSELGIGENLTVSLVLALGKPSETVELVREKGDIRYYRENGVHYVPKRSLEDVLI